MARIPYSKLKNLRSGQTVWRVCGHMSDSGKIDIDVQERHILGKKVLYDLGSDTYKYPSLMMVWKRAEMLKWPNKPHWMYGQVNFLEDLQGIACFDTRRSAERFVKEVHAGLHMDVVDSMEERRDLDNLFNYDDYNYENLDDYDDYNYENLDDYDDGQDVPGESGDGHDTPEDVLSDSPSGHEG